MFAYRSFWIIVLLKIVSSATISNEDIDKILGTRTDLGTDGGTDGYPSMADIDELKMRLGAFAGLQDEPNDPGDILESRENEDEEGLHILLNAPNSDRTFSSTLNDVTSRLSTLLRSGHSKPRAIKGCRSDFERRSEGIPETTAELVNCLCNRKRLDTSSIIMCVERHLSDGRRTDEIRSPRNPFGSCGATIC